jgi:hypothetical protein
MGPSAHTHACAVAAVGFTMRTMGRLSPVGESTAASRTSGVRKRKRANTKAQAQARGSSHPAQTSPVGEWIASRPSLAGWAAARGQHHASPTRGFDVSSRPSTSGCRGIDGAGRNIFPAGEWPPPSVRGRSHCNALDSCARSDTTRASAHSPRHTRLFTRLDGARNSMAREQQGSVRGIGGLMAPGAFSG